MHSWQSKGSGGDVPSGRVEISDVRVAFGDTDVLHGVNFDVAREKSSPSWGQAVAARPRC